MFIIEIKSLLLLLVRCSHKMVRGSHKMVRGSHKMVRGSHRPLAEVLSSASDPCSTR